MRLFIKKLLAILLIASSAFAAPKLDIWEMVSLGTQPALTKINLYGYNGAITTTYEMAWPESAAYAPLSAAMSTPYCASSSANDASAGTGARTITVKGLNTSFAAFTETVTLNGTTSVNLATANVLVIHSIEVATAGSGGTSAGIIQCGTGANTAGDPAVTHAYLTAGSPTTIGADANVSSGFIYGVPASKTLICRNISVGNVFATAASATQVAIDGYTNLGNIKRYFEQRLHTSGSTPSTFPGIITFPEKTIIIGKLAGPTGTNTGPADIRAECVLIDNNYIIENLGLLS